MKQIKIILTFLIFLVTGRMAGADVAVNTDFYFPMKIQDYNAVLLSQPLEGLEKSSLPVFTFKKPFKTSILNSVLDISYSAQVKASAQYGRFDFSLDISESSFLAEKVVTDDVIYKTVGGIQVSVSLKGTCTDVGLHSTTGSKVLGSFEVTAEGATLVAKIDQLSLNGLENWVVKVGHCDGPVGYQKALEGELKKFVKDPKAIADMFKSQLENKLNSVIKGVTSKILAERQVPVSDSVSISLQPNGIYLNKETGLAIIYGSLSTVLKAQLQEVLEVPAVFAEDDEKKFSNSGFIISQEYVKAISNAFYKSGYYQYNFSSLSFSALKNLFNSRLFQFFLWQDLFKFKLGSVFQFSTTVPEAPLLSSLGSKNGTSWFDLLGPATTQILAPQGAGTMPYMKLKSQVSAKAYLSVVQGQAVVGFQGMNLNTKSFWDAEYYKNYKPRSAPSVNFFIKKIVEMVSAKKFKFDLPELEVGESQVLEPKSFVSDQKWIQLVYQPTKDN